MVDVTMEEYDFDPANLQIKRGDTVTWTNKGTAAHTATADDNSFNSGRVDPGNTFSYKFNQVGTVPYRCIYHGTRNPPMRGTITVT